VSAVVPTFPSEEGWPEDAVEVGIVVDAWGLKGWIKVKPFASDPQALFSSRSWFLKPSEKAGVMIPSSVTKLIPPLLRITQVKEHGDVVVALAQEVPDRDAAETLRGARVFIGRSSFPSAGAGEFYWVDLIGLSVVNRHGERLGTVAGLIDTGPHSVLRVAAEGVVDEASERLIPFVAAYVDDVNLAHRLITVDWGLDF
jgi:16S rRNA processing protein RimM